MPPVADTRPSPFFRLRWVLRMTRDSELPAQQAAVAYALLANANRQSEGHPAVPDGLMLDVPEQCRVRLREGDEFALGGTWIEPRAESLCHRLELLTGGLRRMGKRSGGRAAGLGGNFEVRATEDLVAGSTLGRGQTPMPVSAEHIVGEIQRLLPLETITLCFTSPLRLERPRKDAQAGHRFFDREYFQPDYFVGRIARRLPAVGIHGDDPAADGLADLGDEVVTVVENRLVWLDLAYGPRDDRKSLGGAIGHVRLRVSSDLAKAALVWGQYARVGKNLHFGFGAYRIEELGEDPFPCRRTANLTELAMRSHMLDEVAEQAGLPSGQLRMAADAVLSNDYRPGPITMVDIPARGGTRRLAIPSRIDRGLQRLVLELIGPGLDKLFETSSLAWRRGLGRHRAPGRIAQAYREGFRFALREDFDRFFDSIDHQELADRLRAYVADSPLVELIMSWMRAGAPQPGRGIPTGAPLSPLLGNLLLDCFDEQIEAQGARLVRYADDFLVLCRTKAQAETMHQAATELAEGLRLALNANASPVLDFSEPFDFLGFRFFKEESWQATGEGPKSLEQIGWFDASKRVVRQGPEVVLPGELVKELPAESAMGILGPGLAELLVEQGKLLYRYPGQALQPLVADHLSSLTILGTVTLPGNVIHHLLRRGLKVILADENGQIAGILSDDESEDCLTLMAQAGIVGQPDASLALARQLIAAKLHNCSALANVLPGRGEGQSLDQELAEAACRALTATSADQLRGIEGAAAARWYERFASHLGAGFHFERRTAPQAEDPVNVLLNIGYTWLYRWMIWSARAAGLSPGLGVFHTTDGRFAALAADFQEPFRHLVDRVVLDATYRLRPNQFRAATSGPFALCVAPEAARQFQSLLHRAFATAVATSDQTEACSYHRQFLRQARSLRRHLRDTSQPFAPFRHP